MASIQCCPLVDATAVKRKAKMAELKNLTIDEISLVEKGDNKGAKILMVKSKDEVSKELTPEDLSAMMAEVISRPRMDND